MNFELAVNSPARRAAVALATLVLCAALALASWTKLVAGVLTDERVNVGKDWLEAGITHAPNSALLNARIARTEMLEEERDLSEARARALRAISISPWDFNHRLLLASIEEAEGDRDGAEKSLRDGLALAPNNTDVHWRLANLLFREGKYRLALDEFRIVTLSNNSYLPATLDMIYRASGGNLAAVEAITPPDPRSRLALAEYLLKQSRVSEAARVFDSIDRNARLASNQSPAFISGLIAQEQIEMARALWVNLVGADADASQYRALIWNGSFESVVPTELAQFDWTISSSNFARVGIDAACARTGARALRIDFLNRDTTRLDGEVKQLISVRAGARYRLSCFVKTDGLVTTEGPRIVVEDRTTSKSLAESGAVAAGSKDWEPLTVDFIAPAVGGALIIKIKRVPRFSYDEPMRGSIWFDDFALTEQGSSK
jgi:tetratricopeptide (TPR) repeat protein